MTNWTPFITLWVMFKSLLVKHGIRQWEVAHAIGLSEAALSKKFSRGSNWSLEQARRASTYMSGRIGRHVTVDELFPPEPDKAAA